MCGSGGDKRDSNGELTALEITFTSHARLALIELRLQDSLSYLNRLEAPRTRRFKFACSKFGRSSKMNQSDLLELLQDDEFMCSFVANFEPTCGCKQYCY